MTSDTSFNTQSNNENKLLARIAAVLANVFPQNAGSSPTATAGAAILPAAPAGFIAYNLNGESVKIPYYNP